MEISVLHLTHWGWVTHICVSKLNIIGSENGLSPGRHQAIIWTNAEILLTEPLGTNFSEMLIKIHIFSSKKTHWKVSSVKCRPFCPGLNVFIIAMSSLSIHQPLLLAQRYAGRERFCPGKNIFLIWIAVHFMRIIFFFKNFFCQKMSNFWLPLVFFIMKLAQNLG